jgi:hypothetical protein
MASTLSPYGLRPIQLVGGQVFAGQFREYKFSVNTAAAIFAGDVIALASTGEPASITTTPVGIKIPATSADATAGIVGVCVGVRYVTPNLNQQQFAQYLPANAVTAGYTDIFVRVVDDPDALFQIQGTAALGTFNSGTNGSGWSGAIGKNAALGFVTAGNTRTGNSGVNLIVGTNGAGLVTTAATAMRVVDVVRGTESDLYPEFVVKFNQGVHSYYNSLGV